MIIMGRIKSLMIKRATKQLLVADKSRFGTEFESNKKALGSDNLPSKSTRNKIAGFLTRLNRTEKEAAAKEARRKEKQMAASEEMPQYEQY
jgi:ribosomal protein S17E